MADASDSSITYEDPATELASVMDGRTSGDRHGGVNTPIELSVSFSVMKPETLGRMYSGEGGPARDLFLYSRHYNPSVLNLGRQLAALEGTEAAYCTSSGMSICHLLGPATAGTHALIANFLPKSSNINTTFVDIRDLEEVKKAIVEGHTKVLYFESISNPTLTVADIPKLSKIAHDKGVKVVVDNAFSPMVLSPARLGADVVVQGLSKYVSGEGDVLAGAICGAESLVNSMMDLHQGALMLLGPTMNAMVAFNLSQRIPHMGLRIKEQCQRALVFAERMKKMGFKVIYLGLEDHPDHQLLKKMVNKEYGYGGILCLDMETEERANKLMDVLQNDAKFGLMAVSFGYYDTLMCCPSSSTSSQLSEAKRMSASISPGLVRMSLGYTGTLEKRWGQFEMAARPFLKA
ncbi:hypothetical protein OSB04_022113 [Centaurea solstitialis]|uniref:Methionine gamma-lyase n=1 Tax=Centaurea solstitialis TaxID=347529 RepID=A0AA38SVH7_9ASTR|nr:hypothetical protein OSB04_022113 [Centaurea solstitialis]